MLGKLHSCANSGFVSDWEETVLDFRPCTPLIGICDNEMQMWNQIHALQNEKDTLPFYCCLAWVGEVQHPTVLYIKHLRLFQRTVRCHVLHPHKAVVNDFGWTLVLRPLQLCSKLASDCNCTLQHAQNFPLKHILAIAVSKGNNDRHRSLFAVSKSGTAPPGYQLIHLPMTKEGDEVFESFSTKRLQYFNDLFLRATAYIYIIFRN